MLWDLLNWVDEPLLSGHQVPAPAPRSTAVITEWPGATAAYEMACGDPTGNQGDFPGPCLLSFGVPEPSRDLRLS